MARAIDTALRQEIEAVFEEALDLPAAERAGWLGSWRGMDERLRAEVGALIEAHERASGILEESGAAAAAYVLQDPNQDRRVGAYRVVRELGRGGMGVVYLAERDDGHFRQQVAIKLLRASPDVGDLHRRFLAERQILASLKHPGIAQLLDGGLADGHTPYLVMEYVDGMPITTYCDLHQLGLGERLRLFREVCAAVHYAHQNLIIHRDLKPGNILVSADGRVKLLDFGIAKLLNPAFAGLEQPLTRTAFRAMTPEYASPEQVCGETVTTTSDVYALGVVLYELLCGRRPYYLTSGSPGELAEVVCTREPERPSAAITPVPDVSVSSLDGTTSPDVVARARGVSVERLRHLLSGDLDAIVMMALRKEPRDRYGSADLLWQDLQRYFDGLPVLAHRGSRLYRARKLLGRHRAWSAAAAAMALSLAVGSGVAIRQASVAERERDRATRARVEAEQALGQSESVTSFLVNLFDAGVPAPGGSGGGRAITAPALLRRGQTKLESLRGQPLMQARLLEAMGRVQMTMAAYPEAQASLERSLALRVAVLGPANIEATGILLHLSEVQRRMGHYRQADSIGRRALALRVAALGAQHPATAEVLAHLAMLAVYLSDLTGAEAMSRRALDIRRSTLDRSDLLFTSTLERHASYLRRLGRDDEAEAELRDVIAIRRLADGPDSPEAAYVQLRLADLLLEARSDTAGAEALYRMALATIRGQLGDDHPRTAWAMGDLAALLAARGQHAEAAALARAGLRIIRNAFGPEHPNAADYARLLVDIYRRERRFADAERLQSELLGIFERSLGVNHSAYANALDTWAVLLMEQGRYDESIRARRRVMDLRRRSLGDRGVLYGIDLGKLAQVYARKGEYAVADSLFAAALGQQRRFVPETHPDVRELYRRMVERYRREGKTADVDRYRRLALAR
jgi:serine/threonine-protein kinase